MQEVMELLRDILQSTTDIDDRRDAMHGLKALSKKHQLEVDIQTMTLLVEILQGDRKHLDLIQLTLETLVNMMTYNPINDEEQSNLSNNIAIQLTELYIETEEHVHAAIDLIEETNFNLRRTAIKFLTVLLRNCPIKLQNIILHSRHMDVSKLVCLLKDWRPLIRRDTLRLLQLLTHDNHDIKGRVVLEYGFECLFEILDWNIAIYKEVLYLKDCLSLLINLLKDNASIQRYFRNSLHFRRLVEFVEFGSTKEKCLSEEKITNLLLVLKIIRILVSPTNCETAIAASQQRIRQIGLFDRLCVMITCTTIPIDLLTETINTIGDLIRGNSENQQLFGSVMKTSSEIQQPIVLDLLNTIVADKEQ